MSRTARYWLVVAAVLGVVAVPFWLLRVDTQRFRVPSEAMAPTIAAEDRITVNKEAYDGAEPEIGDIVVFHPPAGAIGGGRRCGTGAGGRRLCAKPVGEAADVTFVKRVVAGPGDRVRVRDGKAIVNGRPLDEPYARECPIGDQCTFRGEITIPDDHWFLMGDNRGASDDSRFWGPVPTAQLVGRVDDCTIAGLRCEKTSDPG